MPQVIQIIPVEMFWLAQRMILDQPVPHQVLITVNAPYVAWAKCFAQIWESYFEYGADFLMILHSAEN